MLALARVASWVVLGLLGPLPRLGSVFAQSITPPLSGFDAVKAKARALAAGEYAPPPKAPRELERLTYDQMREIRYRPDHALWKGSLFNVQLFHLGYLYDRPVQINVVRGGVSAAVEFRSQLFDYGKSTFKTQLPPALGFAGFRLHYPLHTPSYADEVAAYLGASYFRILGREQQYGLSARGLAIDTALAKGEEFPVFREFWLEEPAPDASEVTYYALLDSPSVTGAYRFVLRAGTETTLEITMHLFARRDVEKLGIAPLTSMMLYGENRGAQVFDDVRPEVHDSDALLVHTRADEWVLRPLTNPRALEVSAFIGESPVGFGLLQRDRDPSHYEDPEFHYHRRPSYWVEPLDAWGPGHVELVEIPSHREIDDNISAYWVSDNPLRKGGELIMHYRMHSLLDDPALSPAGRAESTRVGSALRPGVKSALAKDTRRFVVEFTGRELALLRSAQPVQAVIESSTGQVSQAIVQRNEDSGKWRLQFNFVPDHDKPSDLRCHLRLGAQKLTETWTYRWTAG